MSDNFECAQCRHQFRTLTDFDRHQDVDYRRPHAEIVPCSPPADLGLIQDAGGTWCIPEGLKARERLATRMAAMRRGDGR